MMFTSRSKCSGFTLLEILIAFTIATTALGLLFRIHASSAATVLLSGEYQEATALAQALITEHAVTERSIAFTRIGSTNKFDWTVRASAYAGAVADASQPRPYALRRIEVELSWSARDRNRRVSIRTIKPFFEPKP